MKVGSGSVPLTNGSGFRRQKSYGSGTSTPVTAIYILVSHMSSFYCPASSLTFLKQRIISIEFYMNLS
jgi:hypothetical protein